MRALANLALAAALGLGLSGCGGTADVGDAEIVPAAPTAIEKPADAAPAGADAPAATAPESEPAKAP